MHFIPADVKDSDEVMTVVTAVAVVKRLLYGRCPSSLSDLPVMS